jgi:photosystem II stability/assembly factor-like uncharacterized protein
VQDVASSPRYPEGILAACAPGGSAGGTLCTSFNAGVSWTTPLTGVFADKSVYDIEFDAEGFCYLATIDSVWFNIPSLASFTRRNLGIGSNVQVFDVAINPANPQVVWAGVGDANGSQSANLLRSPDRGNSWVNRTPPTGFPLSGRAIAIDPAHPAHIAVAFANNSGERRVWYTPDDGATWFDRSPGLPIAPIHDIVYSAARLLVTGGAPGAPFGLFSSTDDGQTWVSLSTTWPTQIGRDIEVSPSDPQHIFVAAPSGLAETTNGGSTWAFGVGGTASLSLNSVRYAAGSTTTILIGSNSRGVWSSLDNGATFDSASNGINDFRASCVAVNPWSNRELAFAFQHRNFGGVYTSTDSGVSWTYASGLPPSTYSTVAFAPTGSLYAISTGPNTSGASGIFKRDGQGTWAYLGPQAAEDYRLVALRFSKTNPNLIATGGFEFVTGGRRSVLWISNDGGQTWSRTYEGDVTAAGASIRAIEFIDDGSDQVMLACEDRLPGGFLRSQDAGQTWSRILPGTAGLPAGFGGLDLTTSTTNPQTLYAVNADPSSGGGVFRSVDAGLTWTNTGYPEPASQIEHDSTDPRVFYALRWEWFSSRMYVVRSTDSGASFQPYDTGLPPPAGYYNSLAFAPGLNPKLLLGGVDGVYAAATESCYPNCDASTISPTLNVLDFNCFLNAFTAGHAYSNCDASTTPPVLNVLDFNCFLNRFSAGCP